MIYQSNIELDAKKAKAKFDYFLKEGKAFELKEKKITRTLLQNSAMHKFFQMVSTELNDLNIEFVYEGLTVDSITMMYTPELVKDFFWRPIQMALFDIKSTKKINTDQMNSIIDIITKFFSDRGVFVEFPNRDRMISAELEKEQNEARNSGKD